MATLDEAFLERMDKLIELMLRNEQAREPSPYWTDDHGRAITRADHEANNAQRRRLGQPEQPFDGRVDA